MVSPERAGRSTLFLGLFALAWSGGSVAYVPFLTLLLPDRLSQLTGGRDIEWLALIGMAGAVAASVANIAAGWLSDRTRTRRPWIAVGVVATGALLLPIAVAGTPTALLLAVVAWQLALNLLLAPLAAWAADRVPDGQRGWLGGVFGIGPAVAAGCGVLVVSPLWPFFELRLGLIAALTAAALAPLLLFGGAARSPEDIGGGARWRSPRDFALLGAARLAVQMAQATLFAFLTYILRELPGPPVTLSDVSTLLSVVLFASVPLTFALAGLADRLAARRTILIATCLVMTLGLLTLSLASGRTMAFAGYAVFGLASASFLALQSGYAIVLLPTPGRHGRDLGLLNLTNTLPNITAPLGALLLVTERDFAPLLIACAALTVLAALLVHPVRWQAASPAPREG